MAGIFVEDFETDQMIPAKMDVARPRSQSARQTSSPLFVDADVKNSYLTAHNLFGLESDRHKS